MTDGRLVALFAHEMDVVAAAQALRDAGIAIIEVYSPYPVHGLERRLRSRRPSRIAAACLGGGLAGAVTGLWLPWWTNAVDWVLEFGGKPALAWPAWVPVVFEMTVLFAALATFLAFILDPRGQAQRPAARLLQRVSDDVFAIEVAVADDVHARLARHVFGLFSALEVTAAGADAEGGAP